MMAGIYSPFSPLNDNPLMGETAKLSPVNFGMNELTYAQGAYDHKWPLPHPLLIGAVNGFMPMEDAYMVHMALGKKPFGPWYGAATPEWLMNKAFPTITNVQKATG